MLRRTLRFAETLDAIGRREGVQKRALIADWLKLRLSSVPLQWHHYVAFGAYRPEFSQAQKRRFVGTMRADLLNHSRALHDLHFRALVTDKAVVYNLLGAHGFPVPRTLAVVGRRAVPVAGAARFVNAKEAAEHFASQDRFPLFCKPAAGRLGGGQLRLDGFVDGRFATNGGSMSPGEVAARWSEPERGMLVQNCLKPDPSLESFAGRGVLPGLRVYLCCDADGTRYIHRTVLKVPRQGSLNDNFLEGSSGNLASKIDPATGALVNLVAGPGPLWRFLEHHPETGAKVEGTRLDAWPRVKELIMEASKLFEGLNIQGWDIALTESGPVLLEVNFVGGTTLPQVVDQAPFIDERLLKTIESYGGWDAVFDLAGARRVREVDHFVGLRY